MTTREPIDRLSDAIFPVAILAGLIWGATGAPKMGLATLALGMFTAAGAYPARGIGIRMRTTVAHGRAQAGLDR